MEQAIGIVEAALNAKTTRKRVRAAMAAGSLTWKLSDGSRVTTRRCVERWVALEVAR